MKTDLLLAEKTCLAHLLERCVYFIGYRAAPCELFCKIIQGGCSKVNKPST